MNHWLVLLRAVNVGGTGKLPMAALRAALEDSGAGDVRTLIQSGNVALHLPETDPDAVCTRIGELIAARFGFRPAAVALRPEALSAALAAQPFDGDPARLHLGFWSGDAPLPDLAALAPWCTAAEQLAPGRGCFYLSAPNGLGRSKLSPRIEPALKRPVTMRNVTTLRRVLAQA
ncbi:DUF1697 domain-containing protein [Pseudooceanicola sp. CBS1P-1]|uniref:DUF1697 domain-containing protein n=1 Tax=Pseudooceanicola albus TaxID=2692189 RepID=A0A6L7FXR4_9RHOB|nr:MULTISPECIES: DUF1697 domain-containing protein [Pseudooceanicola]MBT9383208.1 DUF1697 domain-containing protein [Pseudooceanicola endophyticus]MXN16469.1 DUF1697 domain-containing protein [Pseudooceanicola albus]